MLQPIAKEAVRYRRVIGRYRTLLAKRKGLVAMVLVLSLVTALVEGVGLSMIYPLLDSVVGDSQNQGAIWQTIRAIALYVSGTTVLEGLIYLAVGVFFIKAVLLTSNGALTALLVGRLREDWSTTALQSFLYGPYADVVAERRGTIVQQVMGETARASKGIDILLNLVVKFLFAVVLTATLFVLNWRLMLAMTVLVIVVATLARVFLIGRMQKLGRRQKVLSQDITSTIAEPIFGASVVKLLGIEERFLVRLRQTLRKLTRNNVLLMVFAEAPIDFIEFLIIVCVVALFAVLTYGFGIPLKEAVPLIGSFALISSRLLSAVSVLINKRLNLASMTPSLWLVHEMMNKDSLRLQLEKGKPLDRIDGDITLRDVWFSYEGGKPIFKGLSLTIPKGKMVGIVGASGIGKSTLGYLLARLYEPDQGSILIDNRDIREFSIESLRRRIGYVEQTPLLFSGTIRDNIRLGAADAPDAQVIEAARAAGVHDFISSLPKGYDTPVSDQGATLSGGERQRIAIARAIIRRPEIFIIDEGTSSLDRKAEVIVQDSIQTLVKDATVIVIAHRITTLKNADLIFELTAGGEAILRTFEEVAA